MGQKKSFVIVLFWICLKIQKHVWVRKLLIKVLDFSLRGVGTPASAHHVRCPPFQNMIEAIWKYYNYFPTPVPQALFLRMNSYQFGIGFTLTHHICRFSIDRYRIGMAENFLFMALYLQWTAHIDIHHSKCSDRGHTVSHSYIDIEMGWNTGTAGALPSYMRQCRRFPMTRAPQII